jgi:N-acetylmuramoyl-L-alanine amidase
VRICASIRRPATLAIALIALLLTSLSAQAGTLNPVNMRVGGKEVALKTPAIYDGHEVYLPLDALQAFGASHSFTRREETVIIAFKNGVTTEVALARPGRQPMVPLSSLTKILKLDVLVEDGVCDIRTEGSKPREKKATADERRTTNDERPVKADQRKTTNDANKAAAAVPVKTSVKSAVAGTDPPKKITEIPKKIADWLKADSNKTGASKTSVESHKPEVKRAAQVAKPDANEDLQNAQVVDGGGGKGSKPDVKGTVGRSQGDQKVLLDLPPFKSQPAPTTQKSQQFTSRSGDVQTGENPDKLSGGGGGNGGVQDPKIITSAKPVIGGMRIQDVTFEPIDGQHARLRIRTNGKPNASASLIREPTRLAIDIANASIDGEAREWPVDHPFLNGIHLSPGSNPNGSRVVLDLQRLVGYTVLPPTPDGVVVNLNLPKGSGRSMRDLIIVVDPGHGGNTGDNHDGCSGVVNGQRILEKNLTLAIALKVQRLLEDAGATVIMTRTTDVFVSLPERPRLATANSADLFVSIHIDDTTGGANTASGTTSYYHFDDPNSRALAHSLVEHIAKVSGLPNRRARSDSVLYTNGLAVLRHSTVPSTLVEVGFMNNSRDRAKMVNQEFQEMLAQAFVNGIQAYVEGSLPEVAAADRNARDTR